MPEYVTDHDLLLPAAGEAETTFNQNPGTSFEYQLAGNDDSQENNEIVETTAADIEQQPPISSNKTATPYKQGSAALSSWLLNRSESTSPFFDILKASKNMLIVAE